MTLYAIRPLTGEDSLEDAEVVDRSAYGWKFLRQAITLWALLDDPRAGALEAVIARATQAAGDGELRFDRADLEELVRLLDGLEEAIVNAGIVDKDWRVPVERLDELARRVPAMDLTTERTLENKTHALAEVMVNATSLRNFLRDALKSDCIVVHG